MTTAVATVQAAVRFEGPDADGIAWIVIDRPDDRVNAIDLSVLEGLEEAVQAARAAWPKGLIVASTKADQFIAGADLKIVTQGQDPKQVEVVSRRFQAVLDQLTWLPCTSVAAIGGPALGGGLEVALACDYRVAADAPSVSLGQTEVSLGLVPAGGGTQRLPRLIGLERALDLILNGRRLNARRARRAGLLDEVVHPTVLDQAARTWAMKPKRPLDRPINLGLNVRAALDVAEQTPPGRQLIYRQARQAVLARTRGQYPAPLKALEAVEIGFEKGTAAGLEAEARAFGELALTPTARNLIWLFLATQRARRSRPSTLTPLAPLSLAREREVGGSGSKDAEQPVAAMGVVGAGFMGAAIAEVGAAAGMPVRIKDVSSEAVARGMATVRKLVDEGVARRHFEPREGRDIVRRVSGASDYAGFARADLVIEAVFEDLTVKHKVVGELEAVLGPEAVIASNTSAIPIHQIAQGAKHPERIVGMHFFSPAQRMPLLEVVRSAGSAKWAIERAARVGAKMGKTVIVVGDSPGFYTSRVLGVMMNEAALLLTEGARLEDVDRAMTAFGFPVGPFVLYDEVGLEVAQHAGETVAGAFGDRIPAATIVADLVARGETGRKAGHGFYIWPGESRLPGLVGRFARKPHRVANPVVYASVPRKEMSETEIQDRLVLLFVNEAIRCLDEGVLASATDGDVGAVLGLGFPPFRGGPFHHADSVGARALVDKLRALAARHGPRYEPAESLNTARKFFEELP